MQTKWTGYYYCLQMLEEGDFFSYFPRSSDDPEPFCAYCPDGEARQFDWAPEAEKLAREIMEEGYDCKVVKIKKTYEVVE